VIMKAIDTGRNLCDSLGFKDCELVINEWHYLGKYSWSGLRSSDSEVRRKVWSGPASHNGIDSSCFNLTVLSKFQSSKLDQGFYYGCRNVGAWGFMDDGRSIYKVYHGLKMFGDFLKTYSTMCASTSAGGVTVLAAKSADGSKKGLIVTDYRSGAREIEVEVKGIPQGTVPSAWVHDYTRDFADVPVRFSDGKLVLDKVDSESAAFLVTF